MTTEYAQIGSASDVLSKYHVILDGYADNIMSEDTIQTGITGKPLIHRSTLHDLWIGVIHIHSAEPSGYGSASDLETLYRSQTTIYWQEPNADTPVGVKWVGNWSPQYINPPLSDVLIPFMFREADP